MLLPVLTTPTSTPIPQPNGVDADPRLIAEGKEIEPSSFEDAMMWFESQPLKVEDAPLKSLEIDFEAPQLLSEEIKAQIGLKKQHHQKLPPIKQPVSLLKPEVGTAKIELPPQQSIIETSLNMTEEIEESAREHLTYQSETGSPSQTSPTQNSASLNFEVDQGAVHLDVHQKTESTQGNEIQTLEVNASLSAEIRDTSISESLQPTSKTVQTVTQQVAEQTMAQISNNSSNQDSSFTVRLDPPELGEVFVSLKKSEGEIIMRVAAIEKTTQALLQLNEVALSQAMTDHHSDVTMEFGSQSDFESSMFSDQKEHVSQRHFTTRHQSNSPQSISLQNLSILEESAHDFTA